MTMTTASYWVSSCVTSKHNDFASGLVFLALLLSAKYSKLTASLQLYC